MRPGSPHFHYVRPRIKHRSSSLAISFYLLSYLAGPMSGSFKSNSSNKYLSQESNEKSEQSPAFIHAVPPELAEQVRAAKTS